MPLIKARYRVDLSYNDRLDLLADPEVIAARLASFRKLLTADDQLLLDLVFVHGLSHRAAAVELNVNAGVVTRRVRRLRAMLASPTVRAIADHIGTLPPKARQVATDHFFARRTISDIARSGQDTYRAVQSQLDYIRGWARALHHERLSLTSA